jgi:hypothetical protein
MGVFLVCSLILSLTHTRIRNPPIAPSKPPQYEEREGKALAEFDAKLARVRDHREKLQAQLEYEEGKEEG